MGWPENQTGGLNSYLRDLLRALGDHGTEATALVVGPSDSSRPEVVGIASPEAPLVERLLGIYRAASRLASDIDVVDSHFALYSFIPVKFGALKRKPLVVHFQGPWAAESASARHGSSTGIRVKRFIEKSVYHQAAEIIVLSAAFKQILVESYRLRPWGITVIPPGVDLDRFRPRSKDEARKSLGISAEPWMAFTARRLVPRTGVDQLLLAWSMFIADHPNEAVLTIAGDGPSRAALEKLATRNGLGDTVRFVGRVSDNELVSWYQAADICVVPSVALEGFGLIVLEALACGTPVVATDSGGLPEALAGLDRSLIVPTADANALARRLQKAKLMPSALPTAEACRFYAESFSWSRIAALTADVYQDARSGQREKVELRVVYLDHCARLSGGEIALSRLLAVQRGVDSHVILAENGPLVSMLLQQGVSVEILPAGEGARGLSKDRVHTGELPLRALLQSIQYVLRLTWRLHRLKPDLVHTNSLKSCVLGGIAARLAGIPVIFHIRDRIADDYLPVQAARLVRAAARWLPAAVIANSQATLETIGQAHRARVVHGGVIFDSVRAGKPSTRVAGPLKVGMVGRLSPWKGQDVFLKAFAAAFPDGEEQAVIIGEALFGEEVHAKMLVRLSSDLGIEGRVQFAGFCEDVNAELANLDILVHASLIAEPFGQVVLEGMAMGLPVVAANDGGPREIISNGVNGVLVTPGDVDALAMELRRLSTDQSARDALGAAAAIRSRDFSPEHTAQQVLSLYREVMNSPSSSGMSARTGWRRRRDR